MNSINTVVVPESDQEEKRGGTVKSVKYRLNHTHKVVLTFDWLMELFLSFSVILPLLKWSNGTLCI